MDIGLMGLRTVRGMSGLHPFRQKSPNSLGMDSVSKTSLASMRVSGHYFRIASSVASALEQAPEQSSELVRVFGALA